MRSLAIMPLKKTSQRIPGKNFLTLGGKPLFLWAHDKLQKVAKRYPDVLTDVAIYGGEDIKDVVPAGTMWIAEAKVVACQDANRMLRRMITAAIEQTGVDYDVVAYMNATSPFTKSETYRECLDAVVTQGFDSACTVVELRGRFWKQGVADEPYYPINHDPGTCPQTQLQSPLIMESDACWAMRPSIILELNRRVSTNHKFIPVVGMATIDINYPADFVLAEAAARSGACVSS